MLLFKRKEKKSEAERMIELRNQILSQQDDQDQLKSACKEMYNQTYDISYLTILYYILKNSNDASPLLHRFEKSDIDIHAPKFSKAKKLFESHYGMKFLSQ